MELTTNKKRPLSLLALVMINVIAIDSLRNLPANAQTGFHILFYYAVCAIVFLLPCILITAQLASHYPKRGGVYVWVRQAFGLRMAFIAIWLQWIYNVVWYPTILTFLAVNIAYLINPNLADQKIYLISTVIGLFALATISNNHGMKASGTISILSAIIGTIIPMLALIGFGIVALVQHPQLQASFDMPHLIPTNIGDLAFIVVVIFSLMGMEMSAVHAQEVKQPEKNYPKALLYSSILIVITLSLASLAIALIVPQQDLGMVTGLDQAFHIVLAQLHLQYCLPVLVFMVIIGGFGSISAWVIGPTKGMMVAADDGCMPALLGYRNRHQAPTAMLLLQLILVIALSYCIVAFQSIKTSYWLLSDLTAQLALLFYIIFFAAAIKLHATLPKKTSGFRIPGGRLGIWITGITGIVGCVAAIAVGFVPPSGLTETSLFHYEAFLVSGIVIACLAPVLIYRTKKTG